MRLILKRIYTCKDYTIGHLYINDTYVCDTLEDADRGLHYTMPLSKIQHIKVKDKTAIPTGTYTIMMDIVSPKYSNSKYYLNICNGKVPRLANVPMYSGVLIHVGNTAADTSGCILVGYNKAKGMVLDSKKAFENLYNILKTAHSKGETISITIKRTY